MEKKINKRVLIITYYWPPSGGAGVQRWLKFAKYLPEFDIEPIILTVDPNHASYLQIDKSLEKDISLDLKVFKTKSFEPLSLLSKILGKKNIAYGGFTNVNKKSILQIVLRFIRGNFFIPDARVGWNKYAYKKAKEIISEYKIDTVITTSPPHSTQLIGLKLKKKLNINWIADFRDPWTDIYYYKDLLHTRLVKRIDEKKEREVLEVADKVIVVGKSLKENFYSKINQEKFVVITNGYDEEDFEEQKHVRPEKFTITYTGTLSDQYNVAAFIEVCEAIKSKGVDFIIRFIGNVAESKLNEFKNASLLENVEIVNYVPHQESIKYLYNSSALLLVIPDFNGNKGILTGKLFEYLASGIPIVGIGPTDGDASEIIDECEVGKMFDYTETEKIYENLYNLIESFRIKQNDSKQYLKYSRKNLTQQLKELIDDDK